MKRRVRPAFGAISALAGLALVAALVALDSSPAAGAEADPTEGAQVAGQSDKKKTPTRRAVRPPRPRRGPDQDGDGHDSLAAGGDDCDDDDVNRFPGNTEVCDAEHHDEDCNPATFGMRDADGDGYPDARCCNRSRDRHYTCGTDCDDGNAVVFPDAQVCARSTRSVLVCAPEPGRETFTSSEGSPWKRVTCPEGGRCMPQPNGAGVCVP
jgi:hypothetical protein